MIELKIFKWSDEYGVGDFKIDTQHKGIFELGNELFNINYMECNPYLMKLFKYTRIHFDYEEEYMKKNNYENLERHKKIHADLIKQLTDIAKIGIHSEKEFYKLQAFIWNWIKNHILKEDKAFMKEV